MRTLTTLAAIALLTGLAATNGCRSARGVSTETQKALHLEVSTENNRGDVILHALLRNDSSVAVAVSRTHGFGSTWLRLEIQDAQGRDVRYPSELTEYMVRGLPAYVCLEPGQTVKWIVNLNDWDVDFGGKIWQRHLRFSFVSGERYRVQATYTDMPRQLACPTINGAISSPWTEFVAVTPQPDRAQP